MESETKSLETFVKIWAWAETNWRKLALGAAVVALVALVVSYVIYSRNATAVLASERLSALRPLPAPDGSLTPVKPEAYLKIAEDYPGTEAASRATLLAAGAMFDGTNYAGALKQFEKFQADYASSPLRPEALFGQAASLEAAGKTAEAGTAFQALITRHAASPLVPRAKLALARIQVAQKQPEQALRLLEEVSKTEQYGLLAMLSEVMQEELKAANPALAARPAMATNSVNILPVPATNRPAAGTNAPAASPKK
jgi:predicted negative regulator of RcsB-dependent stress response